MSQEKLKRILSQLPAWGALVLGVGALVGQDARASTAQLQPSRISPDSEALSPASSRSDEVAVRINGESIYVSHDGCAFEELRLANTPETAHLRKLLQDAGAVEQPVVIPIGAMIVASGGGSGKGLKPKQDSSRTAPGEAGKGK
jgi:hypothetical protein